MAISGQLSTYEPQSGGLFPGFPIGTYVGGLAGSSAQSVPEDSGDLNELDSSIVDGLETSAMSYDDIDSKLAELAKENPDYQELYLKWIMENYFTNSARSYDQYMSNTSFSRLMKDIEAAGYNPWLALQSNIGSASYGGGTSAGSISSNILSSQTSRENNKRTTSTSTKNTVIKGLFDVFGGFLKTLLRFVGL